MLQNRLYRGEVAHEDKIYPGQHEAVVDSELWQIVQARLAANRHERSLAASAESPSLLAGLIVDGAGTPMTPTHATKRGRRYRYYLSASLLASDRPRANRGMRVPAGDIEGLVLDRLRVLFSSKTEVDDVLTPLDLDAHSLDAALCNASALPLPEAPAALEPTGFA
jgi:site-specific DNA recombinase